MKITKEQLENEISSLLGEWCDGLLNYQLDFPNDKSLDGALICPACHVIHGRCHDAVYPLLAYADYSGNPKYVRAAEKLFDWGENLLCDDGSLYNDAQMPWNGITVFNVVSLCDALSKHGRLLDEETRQKWERRLSVMSEWLFKNLTVNAMSTNINYFAANSCAMALAGIYFERSDYVTLARELERYCLDRLSENGLLFGEGKPIDALTPKGCRAIDVGGYNVEESLPSLCRCAIELGDSEELEVFRKSFRSHLEWMLPDGAWDNSVGTRAFKWTYWGSRTSDGCNEILFVLGKDDPVYAEAALRNLRLYRECTHDGLFYGGRDYYRHGEKPCLHHAFCHAKTLAGALDSGLYGFERVKITSDEPEGLKYYPELDTFRVSVGPWRADVTAYDFDYMTGGHASGGTMSLLWHKKYGPVIASGAVDYSMVEPHNQQLSLRKAEHRSVCPRVEFTEGKKRWAQHYDFKAKMTGKEEKDRIVIHADSVLCDKRYVRMESGGECSLDYCFTGETVSIRGTVSGYLKEKAEFILPVVDKTACVNVKTGSLKKEPEVTFNLNPGFICREYRIKPDFDGVFEIILK